MDRFALFIADFLDYIRTEKGLSSHTIEAYGRDIGAFAASLAVKDWKLVTSASILEFLLISRVNSLGSELVFLLSLGF